jgi:Ca2+-binding RTX toxin-like protein
MSHTTEVVRAFIIVLIIAFAGAMSVFAAPSAPVTSEAVATTCFGLAATVFDHSGGIVGTPGDDVIIGDDRKNFVYGEGGTDHICTGGGDDEITYAFDTVDPPDALYADGGTGDDYIDFYGHGAAELIGGEGDDTLQAYGANVPSVIRGGPGNDYMQGGSAGDDIFGEDGNDWLNGNDGDDTLVAGRGRDELYGMDGVDSLDGGNSKNRRGRNHRDICGVGSGDTTVNCEREFDYG